MARYFIEFYKADLPYGPNETYTERRDRRARDWAILKAAGIDKRFEIQFRSTATAKVKADAKAKVEAWAADVTKRTGIKLEVCLGSYL